MNLRFLFLKYMFSLVLESTSSLQIQSPEYRSLSLVEMSLLSSHILSNRYHHQSQPITIFYIFRFDYFIILEYYQLKMFSVLSIYFHWNWYLQVLCRYSLKSDDGWVYSRCHCSSIVYLVIGITIKVSRELCFLYFPFSNSMIIQMINSYSLFYIRYVQFILPG